MTPESFVQEFGTQKAVDFIANAISIVGRDAFAQIFDKFGRDIREVVWRVPYRVIVDTESIELLVCAFASH